VGISFSILAVSTFQLQDILQTAFQIISWLTVVFLVWNMRNSLKEIELKTNPTLDKIKITDKSGLDLKK